MSQKKKIDDAGRCPKSSTRGGGRNFFSEKKKIVRGEMAGFLRHVFGWGKKRYPGSGREGKIKLSFRKPLSVSEKNSEGKSLAGEGCFSMVGDLLRKKSRSLTGGVLSIGGRAL